MKYRNLGQSELTVSEIGLGCNNFGLWTDERASIDVIRSAMEMGLNYFDTADAYGGTRSEEFLGKALKKRRSEVVVATKFGLSTDKGRVENSGSGDYVIKAVEASLKRLQTDYIDVYQMHLPDPITPIDETLQALDKLLQAGKLRYIGCSNFAAWQLCEATWISRTKNLPHFITVQSRYNLLERQVELELVPFCRSYDIGLIPWGPLAGGFLTGKYRRNEKFPPDGRLNKESRLTNLYKNVMTGGNWKKLSEFEAFAKEHGYRVGQLAIAWLLAKPWVTNVIVGARKGEQLKEHIAACRWKLSPSDVAEVEAISGEVETRAGILTPSITPGLAQK